MDHTHRFVLRAFRGEATLREAFCLARLLLLFDGGNLHGTGSERHSGSHGAEPPSDFRCTGIGIDGGKCRRGDGVHHLLGELLALRLCLDAGCFLFFLALKGFHLAVVALRHRDFAVVLLLDAGYLDFRLGLRQLVETLHHRSHRGEGLFDCFAILLPCAVAKHLVESFANPVVPRLLSGLIVLENLVIKFLASLGISLVQFQFLLIVAGTFSQF